VGVNRAVAYPWVGCAEIWLPGRLGRISRDVPLGGVGSSPQLSCVREESEFVYRHVTCVAEGRGKDLVDAFHVDELASALLV
jgi:hypothetical protein